MIATCKCLSKETTLHHTKKRVKVTVTDSGEKRVERNCHVGELTMKCML
jgi:hypothetical protein